MRLHRSASILLLLLSAARPTTARAQAAPQTYCNLIDLDYKYNFQHLNQGISYRSGADPVVMNHTGG